MITRLVKSATRILDRVGAKWAGAFTKQEAEHLVTGRRGEDAAYFHLRTLGYVVVARNWRSRRRKGEIDLIGWDNEVLCFVEVKTRTTRDVKPAEAAVDREKQRELRAMAREYLWRAGRSRRREAAGFATIGDADSSHITHRFDVVSVYYDAQRCTITDITLFRNAFTVL